jgi:outer membrane protein assembly factor BamB
MPRIHVCGFVLGLFGCCLLAGCAQPESPVPKSSSNAASTAVDKATESEAPATESTPAPGQDQQSSTGPATAESGVHLTSLNAAATDSNWPAFRGPSGMGTSSATSLPLTWNKDENIAWKVEMPGPGAASPIVFGDRIYVTAYSGFFVPGEEGNKEDLKRHLLALNRKDGSLIWEQKVPAKLPEEDRIRDHGFAASTPAADSERIYVFFGKTGVIAFNHEGNEVWRTDVGSGTHNWGSSSSPTLYKDLVFINASVESETLYALDRKSGEVKWKQKGIEESWNTPVVVQAPSGRMELIVTKKGKVLAFDPETGDPLWNCDTDIGWYMVPSVIADQGIVYVLGGRSGNAALAVKAGGSGDVTDTHRLWTSIKGSNVTSPVYLDKHLYWMHEQRGVAYCAKVESGEITYEERLERAGQVYASALLAEGRVYYLTRDGKTFVLEAKPEFKQLAVNDLNDRSIFNASPAVDGSRLLIRSDKFLYCVGK